MHYLYKTFVYHSVVLYFLVLFFEPRLFAVSTESGEQNNVVVITDVQIASLDRLSPSVSADKDLAAKLRLHLSKKIRRRGQRIDVDELLGLKEFAMNNKSSKAALTAKFVIAWMQIFEGEEQHLWASRQLVADLALNYRKSTEGEIASKYLWKYLDLVEERHDPNIPIRLEGIRKGLSDLLPLARKLDESKEELVIALRERLVNGLQPAKLEAMYRVIIAMILLDLGEEKQATVHYKEIIRDFPDTPWSLKAERELATLRHLKEKGKERLPRLGFPRTKERGRGPRK